MSFKIKKMTATRNAWRLEGTCLGVSNVRWIRNLFEDKRTKPVWVISSVGLEESKYNDTTLWVEKHFPKNDFETREAALQAISCVAKTNPPPLI